MERELPDPEFWKAVLDIHNKFVDVVVEEFGPLTGADRRCHVFRSFQIVSSWLDRALCRGWLEESNS
jgi:hypothetical protein